MFSGHLSPVFKRLRIVRLVDSKRNSLVYLTYSDRLIEGSPQNSMMAVPAPAGTVIPVKQDTWQGMTRARRYFRHALPKPSAKPGYNNNP